MCYNIRCQILNFSQQRSYAYQIYKFDPNLGGKVIKFIISHRVCDQSSHVSHDNHT